MNESDVNFYDEIHVNTSGSNGTNKVAALGTSSDTQNNVAVFPNSMQNDSHETNEGTYHYINDVFRSVPVMNTMQSSASNNPTYTQVAEGNDANEGKRNTFNRILSISTAFIVIITK